MIFCGMRLISTSTFRLNDCDAADDISPRIRPGHGKANLKQPASIAYNRNIVSQDCTMGDGGLVERRPPRWFMGGFVLSDALQI